jgi:uncharacterized protein (DUF934 family)
MALIIKNREVVEDDWTVVRAGEDGTLPTVDALPAKVIVPFTWWKEHKDALTSASAHTKELIGVWLAPDDEPAELVEDFDKIALIAVDFPKFSDGRGFSIGRLLRERYQWKGELRAIGDVLRDQLRFHARCGFDAFAVRADKDIHDALNAFDELSVPYQGAVDDPNPLFRRREQAAAGASA